MDYYELRKLVSRIVPRMTQLSYTKPKGGGLHGNLRKKNYSQFNLRNNEWVKKERLLKTEQIDSFLEISVRAAACPMPFNMDVWDGLRCPFACVYCYADAFRDSLYSSFFDNSRNMGLRHCNPDFYKNEMDKMLKFRSYSMEKKEGLSGVNKAFSLEVPVRLGIQFEDFTRNELRKGVSLTMLKYLAEIEYPVMINTKSDIIGDDDYVRALADNPAKTAIHMTMISSRNDILKNLEPGAPSYEDRLRAMKNLVDEGVRVVARIEPFIFLLVDEEEDIRKYIEDIKSIGVENITFDTYSYTSIYGSGGSDIRGNFMEKGLDFDRIFTAGCESQPLGSILLGKFMELFRDEGISCSTFDMGNVPSNDQSVCCEVGDWFEGGFNYGCTVMAARYISKQKGKPVTWSDFARWVVSKGGFLTEDLRREVKELWNLSGTGIAYSHRWAAGLTPIGRDEDGLIWMYDRKSDYREKLIQEIL